VGTAAGRKTGGIFNISEMRPLAQDLLFWEGKLFHDGYTHLAGLDEAGRGPLAGPVVAAAVILPNGLFIEGVRDSKQLTPLQREKLFLSIQSQAVDYGIGIVDPEVIDRINILQATRLAMQQALMALKHPPDFLLIDALDLPDVVTPQLAIVKGDALCHSIAAASILAKVTRDRLMLKYHLAYPQYNFLSHKGYGTAEHLQKLKEFGPCPIHRRSFKGVKEVC
jgi:ribonuclease HII